MQATPTISADFCVTLPLLCLSSLVPGRLRFLSHGRRCGGLDSEARGGFHTKYNSYVRQAMLWMYNYRVLFDYHNTEVDCVISAESRGMYEPLTDDWAHICSILSGFSKRI